jgi:hypothetical protein
MGDAIVSGLPKTDFALGVGYWGDLLKSCLNHFDEDFMVSFEGFDYKFGISHDFSCLFR